MAKAFCVITSASSFGPADFRVSYSVAIDSPARMFSSDFKPNTAVSVAQNLTDLKTKVVADCAVQGASQLLADVIVFGGPS